MPLSWIRSRGRSEGPQRMRSRGPVRQFVPVFLLPMTLFTGVLAVLSLWSDVWEFYWSLFLMTGGITAWAFIRRSGAPPAE